MNMRDLIPWGRNQQTTPGRYRDEGDPFMTLHREMNRLFDDAFRNFEVAPFRSFGGMGRMGGWPHVEVIETDKDVRISAELPGMEDKDVEVLMGDGVLTIRGEKKSEIEDKDRAFKQTFNLADHVKVVGASLENGLLTIDLKREVPEALKPRRIEITTAKSQPQQIEHNKAA